LAEHDITARNVKTACSMHGIVPFTRQPSHGRDACQSLSDDGN
jgi:hypothetical protein